VAKQEAYANPLSIVVVTNAGVVGPHIPVAPAVNGFVLPEAVVVPAVESGDQIPRPRRPCARLMRMKNRLINFANSFRKALGLPLIQTLPDIDLSVLPLSKVGEEAPNHEDRPHHHKHHHHHHKKVHGTFLQRVHRALMALGPWEGRAVAFVLGMFMYDLFT
jgi:hypothetical protein